MELDLQAQFQEMERLHPWLTEAAGALQLTQPTVDALNLCLEEMVVNTIQYGFDDASRPAGAIRITLEVAPPGAILEISDNARPFNPLERRAPDRPGSLDEADIGGLGIELVRNFSESMRYERRGDRNWLQVVFRMEGETA